MSYIFLEGFESDIRPFWRYGGTAFSNNTPGRLVGSAESTNQATAYARIDQIQGTLNEGSIGFGILTDSSGPDTWAWVGLGILNELQLSLRVRKAGSSVFVQVFRGSPGDVSSLSPEVLLGTTDQWYFVQMHTLLLGAGGSIEVIRNGDVSEPLIELFNLDATLLSSPGFNSVHFHTRSTFHFDDLHVWDAASSGIRYGAELALIEREVAAGGDVQQWTPVGGVDAQSVLSDNDESTYLESSTTGQVALMNLDDLGALADVVETVQINAQARTSELGFRNLRVIAREGGVTADVEAPRTLASSKTLGFRRMLNSRPSGGAWDQASYNDLQIGFEVQQ